jgi:hypothetical protein
MKTRNSAAPDLAILSRGSTRVNTVHFCKAKLGEVFQLFRYTDYTSDFKGLACAIARDFFYSTGQAGSL